MRPTGSAVALALLLALAQSASAQCLDWKPGFGAVGVGANASVRALATFDDGTGQALYAAVTGGLGMGMAVMLAGSLYADFGGRAYWAMAACCCAPRAADPADRHALLPLVGCAQRA